MQKQEFIKKHSLSDTIPESCERGNVSVNLLCSVLDAFLDANFRGAFTLEKEINEDGYIAVSVDYLAYFLRTLLADIYGRELLRIKLYSSFGKLQLEFSYGKTRLTKGEETELLRIAQTAGFTVSFYHSRVFISAKIVGSPVTTLYAISAESLRGKFSVCFFGDLARKIERYNKDVKGLRL